LAQISKRTERIELESYRAISGADYVRQRILHALALGYNSLESQAYLIKSRVKRVDSLILKVIDRRKRVSSYAPSSVTDIVGLRLLTLFRNELPALLRAFLIFLQNGQAQGVDIFPGQRLADAVIEIKIYTREINDEIVLLCTREFMDFGFESQKSESGIPWVEILRKDSEYSSIHIVVLANGPGTDADRVPVEVQIRTSLEDVWGEIDHRLRYKFKSDSRLRVTSSRTSRLQESTTRQLKTLKHFLDSCSEVADGIEDTINDAPIVKSLFEFRRERSIGLNELLKIVWNTEEKIIIGRSVAMLNSFYQHVFNNDAKDRKSILSWVSQLNSIIEDLVAVQRLRCNSNADEMDHIYYRLTMEIALTEYWQAIILRKLGSSITLSSGALSSDQAARRSLRRYLSLSQQGAYRGSAALWFRVANVIAFMGSTAYALTKFREAYIALETDTSIPHDHYLRVRIARQYGFELWREGRALERQSYEFGDPKLSWPRERDAYLEALRVTLGVRGRAISGWESDRSTNSAEEENEVTANNILYYAICFLECDGSWSDLETAGLGRDSLRHLVEEAAPRGIDGIVRVTLADTIRKAGHHLDDGQLIIGSARKVLQAIDNEDLTVPLDAYAYNKMRREAEADLKAVDNSLDA